MPPKKDPQTPFVKRYIKDYPDLLYLGWKDPIPPPKASYKLLCQSPEERKARAFDWLEKQNNAVQYNGGWVINAADESDLNMYPTLLEAVEKAMEGK